MTDATSFETTEDYLKQERSIARRILEQKWRGGPGVRYGKEPHQVTKPYPGMKKIERRIPCRWVDGEPRQGYDATIEALIDGEPKCMVIEAQIRDQDRVRTRPAANYKGIAEKWVLRRWHIARGTPVNNNDEFLTEPEFVPPTIEWDEPEAA